MVSPTNTQLAYGSLGASAGGGLLQSIGGVMEGQSKSAQYKYQAGVALENRKIALSNRDHAYAAGESEAIRYGMKSAQDRGMLKAQQGASNVDVGGGSARDVREARDDISRMDMGTIRANAARVAYGHEVKAYEALTQAQLYEMGAGDAERAGYIKGAGSLISTAGSVSDKWLQMGQYGLRGDSYGASSTTYKA